MDVGLIYCRNNHISSGRSHCIGIDISGGSMKFLQFSVLVLFL